MDGVLIVDKPQGLTSHDVVAVARRSLHEPRIGHTGTLDPLATGVLPLACGRATRLVRFFVSSDKDYEATVRFGVATDTYDITGTETSCSGRVPEREAVEAALASLRGEYLQVPPAFSAKKIAGERAYARARRDEVVTLQPAPVRVTRADLVEFNGASARIDITCSAGFYVRTFAHSLGELVATGACLESLRRTRSGEFSVGQAVELEQVRQSSVAVTERWIPLERLLQSMPSVRLGNEGRKRVAHGQMLGAGHVLGGETSGRSPGAWVRLIDEEGQLVALGTVDSTREFLHP
ncbi:MAG TPA: tRNA pseudouridine(55) synthase TruB, partial [Vicinamibacterales bacterium]|nr:tRNA pseudouridine(55) synthase TruB [Vicinamibacterales bacterium]